MDYTSGYGADSVRAYSQPPGSEASTKKKPQKGTKHGEEGAKPRTPKPPGDQGSGNSSSAPPRDTTASRRYPKPPSKAYSDLSRWEDPDALSQFAYVDRSDQAEREGKAEFAVPLVVWSEENGPPVTGIEGTSSHPLTRESLKDWNERVRRSGTGTLNSGLPLVSREDRPPPTAALNTAAWGQSHWAGDDGTMVAPPGDLGDELNSMGI